MRDSKIPTVAYITGDAASAGSYIALNADKIAMANGSMIGAAYMVDASGNPVEDAKLVSWWKTSMASAAEASGRNPEIAKGMADLNLKLEVPEIGLTEQAGDIISLANDEALKTGYADTIANSTEEVIAWMDYSTQDVFRMEPTFSEKLGAVSQLRPPACTLEG